MDTNEQIKHIRTQHDMTQNEFAASLGISRSALTQLEAGHTKPSFDLLQKLIDQYDVDVNVFFNSSVPQKKTLDDVSEIGQRVQKILKFYDDQYGLRYNSFLEERLVKQVAEEYPDLEKAETLMKVYDAYLKFQGFVGDIELILIDPLKRYANKVRKERVAEEESDDRLLREADSPEAKEHLDQIMNDMMKYLDEGGDIVLEILEEFKKNDFVNVEYVFFTNPRNKFLYSSREECLRHFEILLKQNLFLEYAEVFGNYYGTSKQWVEQQLAEGKDIILEIDWQGAQQIKQLYPESVAIFILPPSRKILEQRLRGRGTDKEEVIQRRLNEAVQEMQHAGTFDYWIVNDEFDLALRDLQTIIRSQRLRTAFQSYYLRDLMRSLLRTE